MGWGKPQYILTWTLNVALFRGFQQPTMDELYLDNLEEYINDENRIVTFKWLSKTLEVHVNQAKQMLFSFVENERNKKDNDNLTVTYFVSGFVTQDDVKTHKMVIAPEESLESIKKTYNPLTSCHIYSVQKCKVKDTGILYGADIELQKEHILHSNKYSAIKCTCAKPRSEDDLTKLRTVAQPTTNAPSFTKPKTDFGNNQSSNNHSKNSTQATKKTAGIAGMFAAKKKEEPKLTDKNGVSSNSETNDKKPDVSSKSQKGKGGGIATFFGNQATKAKPVSRKDDIETSVEEKKAKSPSPVKRKASPSPVKRKGSPSPKSKSTGRRKADELDDENTQEKKRRRIKKQVWSDSSEDEEEMEEEPIPEPAPPSPCVEEVEMVTVPSPNHKRTPEKTSESEDQTAQNDKMSPESHSKVAVSKSLSSGKRRKRQKKMVTKTFVDDGGYMVTEKVWEDVSESASEGEDAIPPTPPVKPKPAADKGKKKTPTKKTSPGKTSTKQTSMMSFFKKK